MTSVSGLLAIVRKDIGKVIRFAAVSAITVPIGMTLLWLFLRGDRSPLMANFMAVTISTIPSYLLNRYWVWQKKGKNSVSREIAPFWIMAFIGLMVSTFFIWIADQFTDLDLVFLAVNFMAFGVVWVMKFFVLEAFLFGNSDPELAESTV